MEPMGPKKEIYGAGARGSLYPNCKNVSVRARGSIKKILDFTVEDLNHYSYVILSTVSRSNRLMTSTINLTAFS